MSSQTDVCFLLEGTYPYVSGGVSTWVHQLVTSLNEFTFSLVVILPSEQTPREFKYELPSNVKEIKNIFLHDLNLPDTHKAKLRKDAWEDVERFHTCPMNSGKIESFESVYRHFFDENTRGLAPDQLAHTREAWNILENLYRQNASDESFIDYFWTFRFVHYPIFRIMSADLPEALVYHTVSTGYAGLLGAIAKLKYRRPLMLTEHGIYTRERRIEISRADWIYEHDDGKLKVRKSQSRFKDLWNKMFTSLSTLCYEYSDVVITLFQGNQQFQLQEGADPKKTMIIPNGLDIASFQSLKKEKKSDSDEFVVGFMGRVVSIKDVKTFIRACKGVADVILKLKVYIMGPTDEEGTYYRECLKLTEFLGLKGVITFTGKVDIKEYYPKIDVLALTSISEAQPLVILEAHGMGIPVVATDVGACREMLYGMTAEDKALGKSGLIAGITNADEIASGIIKLWRSKKLRDTMGAAGKKRVANFYNRTNLDNQYRRLYERYTRTKSVFELETEEVIK